MYQNSGTLVITSSAPTQMGSDSIRVGWSRPKLFNHAPNIPCPSPSMAQIIWETWAQLESSEDRASVSGRDGGEVRAARTKPLAGRGRWPLLCGPLSQSLSLYWTLSLLVVNEGITALCCKPHRVVMRFRKGLCRAFCLVPPRSVSMRTMMVVKLSPQENL